MRCADLRHPITRKRVLVGALIFASWTSLASAQNTSIEEAWPNRNIKLIVPFQPGSSSDAVARIVGQKLGERLGKSLVIENRTKPANISEASRMELLNGL